MRYGSVQDFLQIPVLHFRVEASATAPANPLPGQIWTDTSVTPNVVRWWDSTQWIAANGTSIPVGYITDSMISPTANIQLSKLAVNPLARANHTGTQTASTISDFDAQVRTTRLDQHAAPTSAVDFNGQRLTSLATPVNNTDAANKAYVDNSRAGIAVKDPVRVASQASITLAAPGATVDGITLVAGDRFLAAGQATGTQNGIYVFNGASTPATRAADADGPGEVFDGSMTAVAEGNYAGYQYIQTATASGAPGTWTQTWVVFTMGGQTYTAGNGLTLSGTVFALDAPVSIANGGTGSTNATAARAALGALGRQSFDLGALTAGVGYTITHTLNSTDVHVMFKTTADSRVLLLDYAPLTATTVLVYPDISFSTGAVRAVVIG